MEPQFVIWGGGGEVDPEVFPRAAAIPPLPDLDPLPRSAHLVYWWGQTRFDAVVVGCAVRTLPWGDGRRTWLDFKGVQVTGESILGPAASMRMLVPAEYVTDLLTGPVYETTQRGSGGRKGLFPPSHPAPPHALQVKEIERRLAGLSSAPTNKWGFAVNYPLFALRQPDGEFVGFGPRRDQRKAGDPFGYAVFTTEAAAKRFLRGYARGSSERKRIRVEPFDRFAVFRRFLRSIRDSGASVLFDPVPGENDFLFVDHSHTAAVLLERYLPQFAWGWSYPVYVLRAALPGFTLHTAEGQDDDGRRWTILPVFTDADLAVRAVPHATPGATPLAVPDADTFARLLREMPKDYIVVFDHEPTSRTLGKFVLSRDDVLANLENMEL